MKKVLLFSFLIIGLAFQVSAQSIGIGGEYKTTDNRYSEGHGIELFYEHDYTDRFSIRYSHNRVFLSYKEVNSSSQVGFTGLGALINYTILSLGESVEFQVGGGVGFYGTLNLGLFSERGAMIFGRTELKSSLTFKYFGVGDSNVGFYASFSPSLMMRSDSHYGDGRAIGDQITMMSFQGGLFFPIAK